MNIKLVLLYAATAVTFFLAGDRVKIEIPDSEKDSVSVVSFSFVGDIMCHSPQYEAARVDSSFDFRPSFSEIKKFLERADFTIGNFETVTAGKEKKYSGYPLFNSPDQLLDALKFAGFDLLVTSNNHSIDRGAEGVVRTIGQIKKRGMRALGTFALPDDAAEMVLLNKNGIKIGMLAYTYGLNGNYLPKEKKFMVNLIDTVQIAAEIKSLKEKGADAIIVYYHFGNEYQRRPSAYQLKIAESTFKYGADIVVGSHPHVVQNIELYNGKKLAAYSLGNFISSQRWRYSDSGVILNFKIFKSLAKDSTWQAGISIVPTWVYKGKTKRGNQFIVLPADTTLLDSIPHYIQQPELEKMKRSFQDIAEKFSITDRQ